MYIGEITPAHLRGRMVAMNQINIVVGVTAAYFINYLIQQTAMSGAGWAASLNFEQNAWRWMLGSEILPALLWLILLFQIPESPRWLMSVGRVDEARLAMSKVMPAESIEPEVASIERSMAKSHGATTMWAQLRELTSRHARMATVVGIVIAAVQPITGINAILTYAPIVFEQTGVDDPLWTTIWIGVVSLLANVLALMLVDRLGRRPVVIFGLLWCAISLGVCAWGFNQATYTLTPESMANVKQELGEEHEEVFGRLDEQLDAVYPNDVAFMQSMRETLGNTLADEKKSFLIGQAAQLNAGLILFAILSFIAAFNVSIGPVMWVVFSEIFPTQLRGIAIPAAHLVTAIVNYFVQQFFPWQLANMGGGIFSCSIVYASQRAWLPCFSSCLKRRTSRSKKSKPCGPERVRGRNRFLLIASKLSKDQVCIDKTIGHHACQDEMSAGSRRRTGGVRKLSLIPRQCISQTLE